MKNNGLHYEYITSKIETGKNLILLHGLTGNTKRWGSYIPHLKEYANVLAIDLIGHGKSDFPDNLSEYSLDNQAEKISTLIKDINAVENILVCHSYSCKVAIKLLQKDKVKFSKIVFISPALEKQKKEIIAKYTVNSIIKFWGILIHYQKEKQQNNFSQKGKASFKVMKKSIEEIGWKSYIAHLYHYFNDKGLEKDEISNLEALLICGKKDQTIDGNIIKKIFPFLKIKMISGYKHLFLMEHQEKILKEIKIFLTMK